MSITSFRLKFFVLLTIMNIKIELIYISTLYLILLKEFGNINYCGLPYKIVQILLNNPEYLIKGYISKLKLNTFHQNRI